MKPVKAWAGYCDGKMHSWLACDEYDFGGEAHHQFAIYGNRKDADKRYIDVRPVLITPAPAPKRRKK